MSLEKPGKLEEFPFSCFVGTLVVVMSLLISSLISSVKLLYV